MRVLRISVVAVALAVCGSAWAQSSPAPSKKWEFGVAPYLWMAGVDGDVKLGRLPETGVEASFSELWDVLDIGAMVAFDGHKGAWGFMFDGIYLDFAENVETPGTGFGTVDVDLTQQYYTAAATCRVIDGKVQLDILGGVRYTDMEVDLTLVGGSAAGRTASRGTDWWDGILGARVRYYATEHWMIMGYRDAGAGDSNLTWQFAGGVNYVFNKVVGVGAGYRVLDQDFDEFEFQYDTMLAGPYIGARFTF